MKRSIVVVRFVAAVCIAGAGNLVAAERSIALTDSAACAALEGRRLGAGQIVSATLFRPPYATRWMNSSRTATVSIPFCRLEGYLDPVPRSHSVFEAWLPVPSLWNGRLLGVGAGGSMGAINSLDLADGVNRRFAAVATDNGHRSPGPVDTNQWALGEHERIVDFGGRAHHLATQAAKAALSAYYGKPAQYSYYYGCSQGGLKGLIEAERYPDDYDGIVVGAPAVSWVNEMAQQAWTVRALTETAESALSVEQMQALQDASIRECAGANGLIDDPRRCKSDPASIQCPRSGGGVCLSPEQVSAVRKIYAGPVTSGGTQIAPGFARGSERGWENLYAAVKPDGSAGGGSWLGVFRYMVFDDPRWSLPQLDIDRDVQLAKRKLGPLLDADSGHLGSFAKRGGRLLIYHGWADQQVPAQMSMDYRAAAISRDSSQRVDSYLRLFMVPGMAHCAPESVNSSSPAPLGPNLGFQIQYEPGVALTAENDALTAVQEWVESGRAPAQLVVRVRNEAAGITARTVRVCAEPANARYRGEGDPLDASNWTCVVN